MTGRTRASKAEKPSGRNRTGSKTKKMRERRETLRNSLFENAADIVWNRHEAVGFSTIPRLLPLVLVLINHQSDHGDPTDVYLDLWARQMDDGFIDVTNEEDFAFSAGYSGTRAVRTWRERLAVLEDLGFIKTRDKGFRQYGYILLVDPIQIISELKKTKPKSFPRGWEAAYISRADEIGAEIHWA